MNQRRQFIARLASWLVIFPVGRLLAEASPEVQVYKSRTCGCCSKWVDHLRSAGFTVTATNVDDVASYKADYGVPSELASCHTAVVGGYVVEGHVPADDVIRLLREQTDCVGIAVPGMPIGSPGMPGPNPEEYEVLAFDEDGQARIFAVHGPA